MTTELDAEKAERVRRVNELQKCMDREKELSKSKCSDLDKKVKETEARRAQLYF